MNNLDIKQAIDEFNWDTSFSSINSNDYATIEDLQKLKKATAELFEKLADSID